MKKIWLAIPFFLFGACTTVELSMEARSVTLSRGKRFQRLLDDYTPVGKVSSACGSRPTLRLNIENCQNDLKNQAASKRATLVIIEKRKVGAWWSDNFIKLEGTAYRRLKRRRRPATKLNPPRYSP